MINIFIFLPVWQKNNKFKSLTPVSQINYRNFCPNISSVSFTEAYQWINARAWTGRRLKLWKRSSRRARFLISNRIKTKSRPRPIKLRISYGIKLLISMKNKYEEMRVESSLFQNVYLQRTNFCHRSVQIRADSSSTRYPRAFNQSRFRQICKESTATGKSVHPQPL